MEILTILEPSSVNLEPTSRRTDNSGLTAALVGAALSKSNHAGLNLLLKRINDSPIPLKKIYSQIKDQVFKMAKRNGWNLTKKGEKKLKILIYLAIYENIAPNVCPSCRGTKYSLLKPSEACRTCRGTGKWKIDDYIKAKAIGISASAYSKTWRSRFDDILILLDTRQSEAKNSIYQLLDTS